MISFGKGQPIGQPDEIKKPVKYSLDTLQDFISTPDGNRTRTALSGHRILSPARLPVPPPG
jgi:hypothetical protein